MWRIVFVCACVLCVVCVCVCTSGKLGWGVWAVTFISRCRSGERHRPTSEACHAYFPSAVIWLWVSLIGTVGLHFWVLPWFLSLSVYSFALSLQLLRFTLHHFPTHFSFSFLPLSILLFLAPFPPLFLPSSFPLSFFLPPPHCFSLSFSSPSVFLLTLLIYISVLLCVGGSLTQDSLFLCGCVCVCVFVCVCVCMRVYSAHQACQAPRFLRMKEPFHFSKINFFGHEREDTLRLIDTASLAVFDLGSLINVHVQVPPSLSSPLNAPPHTPLPCTLSTYGKLLLSKNEHSMFGVIIFTFDKAVRN